MSATRNGRRLLTGRDLYRAIFLLATIAAVGLFLRDILTFLMLFLIREHGCGLAWHDGG